jgi:hypothetical protein
MGSSKRGGDAEAERVLGKSSTGKPTGLVRHDGRVLWVQRHGISLREDGSTSSPPHRGTHCQTAGSEPSADFATSIRPCYGLVCPVMWEGRHHEMPVIPMTGREHDAMLDGSGRHNSTSEYAGVSEPIERLTADRRSTLPDAVAGHAGAAIVAARCRPPGCGHARKRRTSETCSLILDAGSSAGMTRRIAITVAACHHAKLTAPGAGPLVRDKATRASQPKCAGPRTARRPQLGPRGKCLPDPRLGWPASAAGYRPPATFHAGATHEKL